MQDIRHRKVAQLIIKTHEMIIIRLHYEISYPIYSLNIILFLMLPLNKFVVAKLERILKGFTINMINV
jgi:hypothetical protein